MDDQKEHPLTKTQHLAAFTVAALFWGVGVAMIDPRTGVGILLCTVGILCTLWLYSGDFKAMPKTPIRKWPWIAILFVLIELFVPGYLLYAKAEDRSQNNPVSSKSDKQSGGQTGGIINNNGPVFNAAPMESDKTNSRQQCPPDSNITIENSEANNNGGDGYRIGGQQKTCIIGSSARGNKGKGFNFTPN